ncbi:NrfD/PsrC family molybdoenzyme membrane anchor subunit [Archaeoglobus sp.]
MLITNPTHYGLIEQPWWGILIAFYLFLGGLGSMAFCVSFLYWLRGERKLSIAGSVVGVVAVLIGILALVLDLGHPERFYLVLLSPNLNVKSWIFIGSTFLSAFTLFAVLFIAPQILNIIKLNEKILKTFGWIAFAFGIGVSAYTGILIGIVFNIPFWNAPALPIIFMISALSTGLATLVLVGLALRDSEVQKITHHLAKYDGFTMIFELIVLAIYLLIRSYGPVGAIESVKTILTGYLAPYFVGGVLLMGLAIPIMLVFGYEVRKEGRGCVCVTILSAIFVLIGGAMLRYVVLKAGFLQVPCCP